MVVVVVAVVVVVVVVVVVGVAQSARVGNGRPGGNGCVCGERESKTGSEREWECRGESTRSKDIKYSVDRIIKQ